MAPTCEWQLAYLAGIRGILPEFLLGSRAAQRSAALAGSHTSIDEYAVTKSPVAYLALIIHLCSGWLDDVTAERTNHCVSECGGKQRCCPRHSEGEQTLFFF